MNFGALTRFAGDRIGGMLGTAYNAVDNQVGGLLPGGVDINATGLGKDIVKDALPGKRKVLGAAGAKKANSVAGHIAAGDIDKAAVNTRVGAATGQLREHFVEEGAEQAIRRLTNRVGRLSVPVVGPVLGTYDTINDAKNAYSGVLEATTGQNLDDHLVATRERRDALPEVGRVMPSDGSIPEITQGTPQNAITQEIKARFQDAASSFNPLKGEWGVSEMLWGR